MCCWHGITQGQLGLLGDLVSPARALTGNGRRACTTQSLPVVAHLDITLLSSIMYITHRNKQEAFGEYVIADS